MHTIGFFKEKSTDPLKLNITTTCQQQLDLMQSLRQSYPYILSACPTNDWNNHSIMAQKAFANRFEFVKTNMLLIAAQHDRFVYNRAITVYANTAQAAKMFLAPNACHELLHESENTRSAVHKVICDFFSQPTNDVALVQPCTPLVAVDPSRPIASLPETLFRAAGVLVASVGIVISLNLIFGEIKVPEPTTKG